MQSVTGGTQLNRMSDNNRATAPRTHTIGSLELSVRYKPSDLSASRIPFSFFLTTNQTFVFRSLADETKTTITTTPLTTNHQPPTTHHSPPTTHHAPATHRPSPTTTSQDETKASRDGHPKGRRQFRWRLRRHHGATSRPRQKGEPVQEAGSRPVREVGDCLAAGRGAATAAGAFSHGPARAERGIDNAGRRARDDGQ